MATYPAHDPRKLRYGPPKDEWATLAADLTDPPETVVMNVNASTKILKHLIEGAKDTGFLIIWNGPESLAIPIARVLAVRMTALTK